MEEFGNDDEPHIRAAAWNFLCAIWTVENLPSMQPKDIMKTREELMEKIKSLDNPDIRIDTYTGFSYLHIDFIQDNCIVTYFYKKVKLFFKIYKFFIFIN